MITVMGNLLRDGMRITHSTLRWGEPTTWGKDVTEVRSPQRQIMPDNAEPCPVISPLQCAVQRLKDWIQCNRRLPKVVFFSKLKAKLTGYYNYHYTRWNSHSVWRFYETAIESCFKWLNRSSQRKSLTWAQLNRIGILTGVPKPQVSKTYRSNLSG